MDYYTLLIKESTSSLITRSTKSQW